MGIVKVILMITFGIVGYWIILFLWFWAEEREKYRRKYGGG